MIVGPAVVLRPRAELLDPGNLPRFSESGTAPEARYCFLNFPSIPMSLSEQEGMNRGVRMGLVWA